MAAGPVKKSAAKAARPVAVVDGFALVRVAPRKKAAALSANDSASVLVRRIGEALKKPGIHKQVVFRDNKAGIYSYSADPRDPTRMVRESSDGTRRVGRLVKGRFVAAKKAA